MNITNRVLYATMLIAAVCGLNSCSKPGGENNPQPTPQPGETAWQSVDVQIEGTKTYLNEHTPFWQADDKLSVLGATGVNAEMSISAMNGNGASFSGNAESVGPYCAVYPYSESTTVQNGIITATIPAVQVVKDSTNVAQGALVATATASKLSDGFYMKNVVALMGISLSGNNFTSIKISSADGSNIVGTVKVNAESGQINEVLEGSSSVTLLPEGKTFNEGKYYIAIIPGNVAGLKMTVTRSNDSRKAVRSSENTLSTLRSKITDIGSYSTNQLEWAYIIESYDDLKAYAADKINWDEDGEIVSLEADIDCLGEKWTPLNDLYDGSFEGNGHKIYNVKVEENGVQHVGFFGRFYKDVRNLTFGSADGTTYDGVSYIKNNYNGSSDNFAYAAPITFSNGTIENVTNFIPVTVTSSCTHKSRSGGISAWIERDGVQILNCTNYAAVTLEANSGSDSNVNIGGILGGTNVPGVRISGCTNYGTVTSSNIYTKGIGGILGLNYTAAQDLIIENCTNHGNVNMLYTNTQSDFVCVGGIVGRATAKAANNPTYVRNCFNDGTITGKGVHQQGVGGIVGRGDGVSIESCTNEGRVLLDHSVNASARWQAMGGILGIGYGGNGNNAVKNCINRGSVEMQAYSCGRVSTSSSSDFYGVTAGGIVGCAAYMSEISGNRNYGSIDAVNNYKAKNAATMRATVYAGGILGYDMNNVPVIAGNVNGIGSSVKASTTYASATYGEVDAGGIVGYLQNSTISSGTSLGSIITSNACTSAAAYAGSIAGTNMATISYCLYGGTVNAAKATASNIVGRGNAAAMSNEAGDEESDHNGGNIVNPTPEPGVWD